MKTLLHRFLCKMETDLQNHKWIYLWLFSMCTLLCIDFALLYCVDCFYSTWYYQISSSFAVHYKHLAWNAAILLVCGSITVLLGRISFRHYGLAACLEGKKLSLPRTFLLVCLSLFLAFFVIPGVVFDSYFLPRIVTEGYFLAYGLLHQIRLLLYTLLAAISYILLLSPLCFYSIKQKQSKEAVTHHA